MGILNFEAEIVYWAKREVAYRNADNFYIVGKLPFSKDMIIKVEIFGIREYEEDGEEEGIQ